MAEQRKSELQVITKAKELCTYVMVVTRKSPKYFRHSFVSRLQNLSLSVIKNLFRANDVYEKKAMIQVCKTATAFIQILCSAGKTMMRMTI